MDCVVACYASLGIVGKLTSYEVHEDNLRAGTLQMYNVVGASQLVEDPLTLNDRDVPCCSSSSKRSGTQVLGLDMHSKLVHSTSTKSSVCRLDLQ